MKRYRTTSAESRPQLWVLDDGGVVLGGGQLFALRLAETADRPVVLVCPEGSPLAAAAAARGLRCVHSPFPAPVPREAPRLASAVRALRRALRPAPGVGAVVVSGAIRASLVAGPALMGRSDRPPLVHLLHERDSAGRRSVRLALRNSHRIVAVGSAAADAYRTALPNATVRHVNNFLAPDALARLVAARTPSRHEPPVLGVLARLIREKGVAELVDELAAVPASSWSMLRVAGPRQDETYATEIERRVRNAGFEDRISLVGPVDDLPRFLAGIDVLLVPSVGHEGQPTVILEGLAAGLPVVARRPMVSADFDDLPVVAYDGGAQLAAALAELPPDRVDPAELGARFGVEQVLAAIDEVAR